MAKTQQASSETALQIKRVFPAPRQRVFRAWTDAAELARWFAPSPDHSATVPVFDLRVGGKYRIEIRHKDGNLHCVSGTYQEIAPPERVVFTWRWELPKPSEESLVTVEFRDLGNSTEVTLTHEQFANLNERDQHSQGWTGCLEQFAKYLGR